MADAELRSRPTAWERPIAGEPALVGPDRVRIHELERPVASAVDWAPRDAPALWGYHLHYFEDLTAVGASARVEWQRSLVGRWIRENPAPRAPAWDPYPTSLRIVNWLKWWMAGEWLPPETVRSLAAQVGHLEQRLEWHLLGNHLFENAKALWIAGACFHGAAAARWQKVGRTLTIAQLSEQVLPDGGHFERSPMYHARMLENVLDLVNVERSFGRAPAPVLLERSRRMLSWLGAMTRPDGQYALFNDAAFGQAPALADLSAYAARLGLDPPASGEASRLLADSGYARIAQGPWLALLDLAPLGPDYLPGHGHADTLTFELSLHGQPLVVDSGTSTYEDGPQRRYERSTAAHNTVTVGGRDSSETWGSFRVGRRARVLVASLERVTDGWRATGRHDGYRTGTPSVEHARTWHCSDRSFSLDDELLGRGAARVAWRMHLHPSIAVRRTDATSFVLSRAGADVAEVCLDGSLAWRVAQGTHAPRFGVRLPVAVLEGEGVLELPARLSAHIATIRG